MKQFIETDFYFLVKESITRNVSIFEWEQAYEQLTKAIFSANAATEKMLLHSSLCYAKAEFSFLQRQNSLKKK